MSNIFYDITDEQLLALAAYGEAASEGSEGMMAVLNVILNRMMAPDSFADADIYYATNSLYKAVVLKNKQFSCFNSGTSLRSTLENMAGNFNSYLNSNSTLYTAYQLAELAAAGMLEDNTGGATHYHTTAVSPSWSSSIDYIGQIGSHLFYSVYSVADRVRDVVLAGLISPLTYIILSGVVYMAYNLFYKKRR